MGLDSQRPNLLSSLQLSFPLRHPLSPPLGLPRTLAPLLGILPEAEEAPVEVGQAAEAGRPSSSSSTGFSNFPARGGGGTSRQQVAPRAPPRQSAPRLQERPAPALPPPSFQNFGQQANTQSNFQTRPAAPPLRPALTFQDTPSSPLPPSALEVVDFNELLGVFQGQGGSSGQRFSSGSSRGFPAQAAVPQRNTQGLAVFQPQNFPARLY